MSLDEANASTPSATPADPSASGGAAPVSPGTVGCSGDGAGAASGGHEHRHEHDHGPNLSTEEERETFARFSAMIRRSPCQACGKDPFPATDPNIVHRDRTVAEVSTAAYDPDKNWVGSSEALGDPSSSGLFIPQTQTARNNDYVFLLAAVTVSSLASVIIFGIRTRITIGYELPTPLTGTETSRSVVEMDVTSPGWSFPDASVSYSLRFVPPMHGEVFPTDPRAAQSSVIGDLTSSALLNVGTLGGPYQAPPIPGSPIGDLYIIRDQRFPWNAQGLMNGMRYEVAGPGTIQLIARVRQTNPATRAPYTFPVGFDMGSVPPEVRFVTASQMLPTDMQARYRHVSGSLSIESGGASLRRPGLSLGYGKADY